MLTFQGGYNGGITTWLPYENFWTTLPSIGMAAS